MYEYIISRDMDKKEDWENIVAERKSNYGTPSINL
jgi:hypothetical protein